MQLKVKLHLTINIYKYKKSIPVRCVLPACEPYDVSMVGLVEGVAGTGRERCVALEVRFNEHVLKGARLGESPMPHAWGWL